MIETKYCYYNKNGDCTGFSRGFKFEKGTISYWIVDRLIRFNRKRSDIIEEKELREQNEI